jgi:hypothetical protein
MSDQNHYEKLGVNENSTFEEIQDARNRLVEQYGGDRKQVESIESAYDAILMDRLRLRQEGKIKVPDRIRFPEKLAEAPPEFTPSPSAQPSNWLQQFIDTPERNDILLPGGLFAAVGLFSFAAPPVALAFGVGFCLYFLNRKERKFGRSFLLTLIGLIVGVTLGLQIAALIPLESLGFPTGIADQTFASLVTFLILWLMSSFLR